MGVRSCLVLSCLVLPCVCLVLFVCLFLFCFCFCFVLFCFLCVAIDVWFGVGSWGLGWVICVFWREMGFSLDVNVCFFKKQCLPYETLYLMMKGAGVILCKGQDLIQVESGLFPLSFLSVSGHLFFLRSACGLVDKAPDS